MISLPFHSNFSFAVVLQFLKSKRNKRERKQDTFPIRTFGYSTMTVFSTIDSFYNYRFLSLDSFKIDKNNQTLSELRSRSVREQNELQEAGGEDNANESDMTATTEKTLDNDDETTLRGKEF